MQLLRTVVGAVLATTVLTAVSSPVQAQKLSDIASVENDTIDARFWKPFAIRIGGFLPYDSDTKNALGTNFLSVGLGYDLKWFDAFLPGKIELYTDYYKRPKNTANFGRVEGTSWGVGLASRFYFLERGWSPYFGAGIGLYNSFASQQLPSTTGTPLYDSARRISIGGKFTIGAELKSGFFGEADYNFLPHPSIFGSDLAMSGWTIRAGYRFSFSKKKVTKAAPATPVYLYSTTVPSTPPPVDSRPLAVLYDGGMKDWIEPAGQIFNQNRAGQVPVVLKGMGSREGRDNILYDKNKVFPAMWLPSDDYWVDKLKRDAANPELPFKSGGTLGESTPLLKSYIVFLMPTEKAQAFERAMALPTYQGKTWALIRTLATKGWGTVGAPANWGKLKMAHTNPTLSNSSMMALVLMYQEFAAANPGKDINNADFKAMLLDIESSVRSFAPSTANLAQNVARNPNSADIAILYESEALRVASATRGLRIVYPSPTANVTVPAAVVQAPWVTPDRAKLANEFIAYLSSDAVQEKTIGSGYRPASASFTNQVTAYFTDKASLGAKASPTNIAPDTDTKTKEGLIYNWNEWVGKKR